MTFEHWIETDLKRMPEVKHLAGKVFSQDSGANKICVRLTDGGESVQITDAVKANVVRSDGETIHLNGTASGNEAYVLLTSSCYASSGKIGIYIYLSSSVKQMTIGAIESYVYPSIIGQTIT